MIQPPGERGHRQPRRRHRRAPSGQPLAVTTCTSGISALLGGGISGCGPVPAETGSRAEEAQPAAARIVVARARRWRVLMAFLIMEETPEQEAGPPWKGGY